MKSAVIPQFYCFRKHAPESFGSVSLATDQASNHRRQRSSLKTRAIANIPSRALMLFLMVVSAVLLLAPTGAFAQQLSAMQAWEQDISNTVPAQSGCFQVTYPNTSWQPGTCLQAQSPNEPVSLPPQDDEERSIAAAAPVGVAATTIGNGVDYVAVVTRAISSVQGSFVNPVGVSSVTSSSGTRSSPNTYSLQINTNRFIFTDSTLCRNSTGTCTGWQQFVYSNDSSSRGHLHIQYWILANGLSGNNLTSSSQCPASWQIGTYLTGGFAGCYTDTDASGASIQTPSIAPSNLGNVTLTGTTSSTTDTAILNINGQAYTLVRNNVFKALPQNWMQAEFNLFGYHSGYPLANFNAGASLIVKNVVNNGTTTAPTCQRTGTTGEQNNLNFNSPCCPSGGASPMIAFLEGSATGQTATCTTVLNSAAGAVTPSYTITASAGTGGAISPSGAVSVTSGTTKAFTLTPNSGYTVSTVGGTCGGTISGNTYTTKAITANCTVTAAFAATTYVISASAGTGGTISNAGAVSVASGATKTYTITPNSGYTIASVGGTCGGTLSGNTYTTKAITASCTVTATFTPVTTSYTITASAGTGGTINPTGNFSVTSGATKVYTITPNSGYAIASVGGTCGGTLSGNTYTTRAITANCTVTAAFSQVTYTITSSAGTGGSISPAGTATVASGATKTYTVTPNSGYAIASVGGTCGGTLSGNTYTTRAITASCTVTAAFSQVTYTITSSAGAGGSISPAGLTAVVSGASRTYTVTPNSGYAIASVGGTCGGTLSGNTYTTRAITASCTITAAFSPVTATSYTVTSSAGTGGSISPAGAAAVASGATRTYTITPNSGYAIASVGGTCGGTLSGNTYTTRAITASCTVTAAFSQVTYTITSSAGTGGSISPAGLTAVASGATRTYTVTPNSGYAIASVGGTCGGTLSGNTYTTKAITAGCTVTAAFTPVTTNYTITSSAGTGGTINPSGAVTIKSGEAQGFMLIPNSGYTVASVGGTCGGTLVVNIIYVTNPIKSNCTVTVTFK